VFKPGSRDLNATVLQLAVRALLDLVYGGAGYPVFNGNDLSYDNGFSLFLFGGIEATLIGQGVF
jgi:hypothetical protein